MAAMRWRRKSHGRVTTRRPGRTAGRPWGRATGARVRRPRNQRVFLLLSTQQVRRRPRAAEWLAGGAMLTAAASWGLLASLLAG